MWWQYLLVFLGAFLFDVVPFPFPPAFTIMVFLQIMFGLNIWVVIVIGVAGSIFGRYILTLYIPLLAGRIFKRSKNEREGLEKPDGNNCLLFITPSQDPAPSVLACVFYFCPG